MPWMMTPERDGHRKRQFVVLALLALGACAEDGRPAAQAQATPASSALASPTPGTATPAPPVPVTLAADTQETTAAGTTFTAPAGWAFVVDGPVAKLTGPEPDLHVAIVESTEKDADAAVAAAWQLVHPGFKWRLKIASPQPGRNGWQEQRDYGYETSPDEKLVLFASAERKGTGWTVALFEGGEASFEKRESAVAKVLETMRPAGYTRESFAGRTPHKLDASRIKQVIDALDKMRTEAQVPGVALALVQDGKVVYEGGLGVRDMGKPDKVDAHTRFMIGSNTKALTTLLLAKLVDEGKLTWDTPVTSLYPAFKLGDADTSRQVLVKHLVCACTGMPRQDMEARLTFDKQTPKSQMELLATMQPTTKFGETFQYSNTMAAAAGYVAGHVLEPTKELGAAYDDAMQSRVFGPLGMGETTFDFDAALRGDHVVAHEFDMDGKIRVSPLMGLNRGTRSIRPAGGAWSTVHDMAKYVQMELAKGKLPSGKQYVSEDALLARRKPQVSTGEFGTYGMGLEVDTDWGVSVVHHGGAVMGIYSEMFWIPDAGVGGVILTNGPGYLMIAPFIRKTAEILFDGEPQADDDLAAHVKSFMAYVAGERARLAIPPDPAVVSGLAKHYVSPTTGDIFVTTEGPTCTFKFGGWKSTMGTRKNDDGTISMVTLDRGPNSMEFVIDTRGGKRVLVLRDAQHEYVFTEAG